MLSIIFAAVSGCSEAGRNQSNESVTVIETVRGHEFTIDLPSNPTTGYSWQLTSLPTGSVQLQNKTFKLANEMENVVGAGGYEVWTFLAVKKETVYLTFEYRRPWEKDQPPAQKKTFRIVIN